MAFRSSSKGSTFLKLAYLILIVAGQWPKIYLTVSASSKYGRGSISLDSPILCKCFLNLQWHVKTLLRLSSSSSLVHDMITKPKIYQHRINFWFAQNWICCSAVVSALPIVGSGPQNCCITLCFSKTIYFIIAKNEWMFRSSD